VLQQNELVNQKKKGKNWMSEIGDFPKGKEKEKSQMIVKYGLKR
jgi:hypothetical protein